MYVIDKVSITNFRGLSDITISLNSDINFFIGRNGTGKTTLINIIASVLQGNIRPLHSIRFSEIDIKLQSKDNRKKPSINVKRNDDAENNLPGLTITIKEQSSDKGTIFFTIDGENIILSEPDDDPIKRILALRNIESHYPTRTIPRLQSGNLSSFSKSQRSSRTLEGFLSELVNTTWLSVHRADRDDRRRRNELSYDTTVDYKIQQINNDLPRYFSSLDSRVDEELNKFQQIYFLSLLSGVDYLSKVPNVETFDLEKEKSDLAKVFRDLNIPESAYDNKLNLHFSNFKDFLSNAMDAEQNEFRMDARLFIAMVDTFRIHGVVEKWYEYQRSCDTIYSPKTNYLQIINRLFDYKRIGIDDRNVPEILLTGLDEQRISAQNLSSGEKQLYILLGEALLQEQKPWIYIADEPELSLHMEWQSEIVSSLRQLNPQSQIIFATHSPEILGPFGDNVYDMEEFAQ